jgi:hypothetical protein
LHDEIQESIVHETLRGAFPCVHNLQHLMAGRWGTGTGGRRCRRCAKRVPRVSSSPFLTMKKNFSWSVAPG